jgi:hypothetical protein
LQLIYLCIKDTHTPENIIMTNNIVSDVPVTPERLKTPEPMRNKVILSLPSPPRANFRLREDVIMDSVFFESRRNANHVLPMIPDSPEFEMPLSSPSRSKPSRTKLLPKVRSRGLYATNPFAPTYDSDSDVNEVLSKAFSFCSPSNLPDQSASPKLSELPGDENAVCLPLGKKPRVAARLTPDSAATSTAKNNDESICRMLFQNSMNNENENCL